jgi:hypothetical protein
MNNAKLFQYVIIWNPTEKQIKEEGLKPKLLKDVTDVLATDVASVNMQAAMNIPKEYTEELSQVQVAVRPF